MINLGTIYTEVTLAAGGVLTNVAAGYIAVPTLAVYGAGGGTILNDGRIVGGTQNVGGGGITLAGGGTIDNAITGTIGGVYFALRVSNAAATLYNAGLVTGTNSAYLLPGIQATSGAALAITNASSGIITGGVGIDLSRASLSLVNHGLISALNSVIVGAYTSATIFNDGSIAAHSGYAIDLYAGSLSLSNAAGGIIIGTNGIYATDQSTVVNAGLIRAAHFFSGSYGQDDGIYLYHGGSVINTGTIEARTAGLIGVFGSFSVSNAGYISAAQTGIVSGYAGEISNAALGTITGGSNGVLIKATGVTIDNSGLLAAADGGAVYANTLSNQGYVNNAHTGTLSGGAYGINLRGGTLTVVNAGLITGSFAGIYERAGASFGADVQPQKLTLPVVLYVSNNAGGTISGQTGVDAGSGGTVTNDGTILGSFHSGVYLAGPGQVSNAVSGVVTGNGYGVNLYSGAAELLNAGTVAGGQSGVYLGTGQDSVVNSGVILGGTAGAGITIIASSATDTITNLAGGTIVGGYGILGDSGSESVTVVNAGTIIGTGGVAVRFQNLTSRLVFDPGAVFQGVVAGGGYSTLELAAGSGIGTIAALGLGFTNFRTTQIDPGAQWHIVGAIPNAPAGVTITNDGTLTFVDTSMNDQYGVITNSGIIVLDPSTLSVDGLVGVGTVELGIGSTLEVADTLALGQSVVFGGSGDVVLGNSAAAYGTIGGFNATTTIDLSGIGYNIANQITLLAGNVLQIGLSGAGTFDLNLDPAEILTGVSFGLSSDGDLGSDVIIIAPVVTAVTASPPTADLGIGRLATITLTMSQPVSVVAGVPTLTLNDGGTATYDPAASTPTALVFSYTVLAGQNTADLTVTGLVSNGATIANNGAQAADLSGAVANPAGILQIDTTIPTAPAALTLAPASDSGVAGDDITNVSTPSITGTGTTGDTVTLYDGTTDIGTTIVVDGTWSVTSSALAAGVHDLTATQTDVPGNVSAPSATLALTIETSAASPTGLSLAPASDSGVAGDDITNVTTPSIIGSGTAGDTIFLYDGTIEIGSAIVGSLGTWSVTASTLAAGLQNLTATETDVAGNVSPRSAALPLTIATSAAAPAGLTLAPASDSGVAGDDITNVTTPVITGTGAAGDTVILYNGATPIGTATVGTLGTWSITSSTLTAGLHSLTATETDVAGNVSPPSGALPLTIDTTIPAAPAALALAPASDSGAAGDHITNVTTPSIIGTGTAGDTISLYDGTFEIGTAVVANSGTWSIATTALAAGVYDLTATETEVAGNVSAPSGTLALTILTSTAAPTGLTLAPASDSGVAGDDMTHVTTPVITGDGIAGETISLYDGTTLVGTGTVAANGTWSITAATLPTGADSLTATETDVAGNISTHSAALTVTIDTTLPPAPAAPTLAAGGNGDVTGTAIAGETITLFDGTIDIGTAIVANSGTWSIVDGALTTGTHVLTATQTDVAGNVSPLSASLTVTAAVGPPSSPAALALAPASDSGLAGDDLTNVTKPSITGTGLPGDTIALYDGTTVVGTGIVAANGTWSIATTTLAAGSHTLTAAQTGATGLVSAASAALTLLIETTAPAAPTISDDTDVTKPAEPVVSGGAPDNATVTVYENGTSIGTATASAAGNWSFAFPSVLAAGTYTLTATDIDVAGNVSAASLPVTVQVNATSGYAVVSAPGATGDITSNDYNAAGDLTTVATTNASGLLLQSVSNTSAILEIYDSNGTLIGTITQPSTSPFTQPVFETTGQTFSATTGSGQIGSQITLISESNVINSGGNDTVTAGIGADTIMATGPTILITGGAGTLFFAATTTAATVTGGSGTSTLFGGTGGGLLEGGAAGDNILAAAGGNTTLVGGGTADTLVGGGGSAVLVMQSQGVAFGGSGATTVFGGNLGVLVGGTGSNLLLSASTGTDALWSGSGSNTLFGGTGSDTLVGASTGATTMVGGSGNTSFVNFGATVVAFGGTANDTFLNFGVGNATIVEGAGNDTVLFGGGTTSVGGGAGTDLYDFIQGFGGGKDIISGFKVGTDQLRLFGTTLAVTQQSVTGGNTSLTLTDGTMVTLIGVAHLATSTIV